MLASRMSSRRTGPSRRRPCGWLRSVPCRGRLRVYPIGRFRAQDCTSFVLRSTQRQRW